MANNSIPSLLKSTLATGDLIYKHATLIWQRLAIGSTGDLLSVAGGIPSWRSVAAALGDVLTTRGDVLQRGASSVARLALGATNTVLGSDGTDATWRTIVQTLEGLSSTQGEIGYRGAGAWAALGRPGNGSGLCHAGGAANPSWKTDRRIVKTVNEVCDNVAGGDGLPHQASGSTLTVDNELFCSLESGKTYAFEILLTARVTGPSIGIKMDINYTSTNSAYNQAWTIMNDNATVFTDVNVTSTINTVDSSAPGGNQVQQFRYNGFITTTGAGTLQLRWAQNTASATSITVYAGSILRAWEAN